MHYRAVCARTPTKVGEGDLREHDVQVFDGGSTLLLLTAQSTPRLWGHLLDAALQGFAEGLGRPGDGRASTRLHHAVDHTQKHLRAATNALLVRQAPDVALLALAVDGPLLHVVSAGPIRAFGFRGGALRKLSPSDERAHGLLKAPASWSVEAIEPGDLLFAGTLPACSDSAVAGAREALRAGPLSLDALLEHLNETRGGGSALGALQIPNV